MGFPAGTPEEAADSLYRLRERQWRRMLMPVFVLGEGIVREIDFTVSNPSPRQHYLDPVEEEGDVLWGEQPLPPSCRRPGRRVRRCPLPPLLALPAGLSHGYHRLAIQLNVGGGVVHVGLATLILAPNRVATGRGRRPDLGRGGSGLRPAVAPAIGASATIPTRGAMAEQAAKLGAVLVAVTRFTPCFRRTQTTTAPIRPTAFLNTLYIDVGGCRTWSIAPRRASSSIADEFPAAAPGRS